MSKMTRILMVLSWMIFASSAALADMGKGAAAPLQAASGSQAATHISEGNDHFSQGHFDVAKKHYMEAEKADPKAAEAHYNLALALDKLGDHKGATAHFKQALELGKNNPEIQNSGILHGHLKMK